MDLSYPRVGNNNVGETKTLEEELCWKRHRTGTSLYGVKGEKRRKKIKWEDWRREMGIRQPRSSLRNSAKILPRFIWRTWKPANHVLSYLSPRSTHQTGGGLSSARGSCIREIVYVCVRVALRVRAVMQPAGHSDVLPRAHAQEGSLSKKYGIIAIIVNHFAVSDLIAPNPACYRPPCGVTHTQAGIE